MPVSYTHLDVYKRQVVATKLMADGVLRGSGAMGCFMIATFADLILRVLISFALAGPLGAKGIWMSWPIGWTIATVLSLGFYLKGKWNCLLYTSRCV